MAWELSKVEDQRKELVEAYLSGSENMTDLSKRFKIQRKTGYKWVNRYREHGLAGLTDQSRAPHNPHRTYDEQAIQMAIDLKFKKRSWGPKKILSRLKRDYPNRAWPSATRLYEIFKELHLVTPRRFRSRVPATHPLEHAKQGNDVWAADFKGDILLGDGSRSVPLTITDSHTRFLLHCGDLPKRRSEFVWAVYDNLFHIYGLPLRIRTDNGPPFGSKGAGRLTPLAVKLIKAGVIPEWINPGHPEENGRHERMHSTLQADTATPAGKTLTLQNQRYRVFQQEYNYERPHEALDMKVPAECYNPVYRAWDGILRSPEYDRSEYEVRKVGASGCIWLNGEEFYITQTLTGEYVGLKQDEEGRVLAHYGAVYLGTLADKRRLNRPKLKPKKIIRRG